MLSSTDRTFLEVLCLKGGCTGSSESTLVKMPHWWKSHAAAQFTQWMGLKVKISSFFVVVFVCLFCCCCFAILKIGINTMMWDKIKATFKKHDKVLVKVSPAVYISVTLVENVHRILLQNELLFTKRQENTHNEGTQNCNFSSLLTFSVLGRSVLERLYTYIAH